MARRRFTPWPAYVDLFSVLMLFTLGAFVAMGAQVKDTDNELQVCLKQLDQCKTDLDDCRRRLGNAESDLQGCRQNLREFDPLVEAQQRAKNVYTKIQSLAIEGVTYDQCSVEDVCIDISLEFDRNDDEIYTQDLGKLEKVCDGIRETLAALSEEDPEFNRRDLQIVVEGHSDETQPKRAKTPRDRFKFNWDLSARRASSVLHQMKRYGVSAENGYNVVSWGLADTDPLCKETTDECLRTNRRTTIRLRFDYKSYEKRVRAEGP